MCRSTREDATDPVPQEQMVDREALGRPADGRAPYTEEVQREKGFEPTALCLGSRGSTARVAPPPNDLMLNRRSRGALASRAAKRCERCHQGVRIRWKDQNHSRASPRDCHVHQSRALRERLRLVAEIVVLEKDV